MQQRDVEKKLSLGSLSEDKSRFPERILGVLPPKFYNLKVAPSALTCVLAQIEHVGVVKPVDAVSNRNSRPNVVKKFQINKVRNILHVRLIVVLVDQKAVCLCLSGTKITEPFKCL